MNVLIVSTDDWQAEQAARVFRQYASQPHRISIWHNADNLGLSAIYNRFVRDTPGDEPFVFAHQDMTCEIWNWDQRVLAGLKMFDAIGVAGTDLLNPQTIRWWDNNGHRHGAVRHRIPRCDKCHKWLQTDFKRTDKTRICYHCQQPTQAFEQEFVLNYGATPAEVAVVDGVFIAATAQTARAVPWDEEFLFDFYDLSFCNRVRAAGYRIGVIDLPVCHISLGKLRTDEGFKKWAAVRARFVQKYGPIAAWGQVTRG